MRKIRLGWLLAIAGLLLAGCTPPADLQTDPLKSKYAHLVDGKYQDAVKVLDQAIKDNPDDLQALYWRATVEVAHGNVQDGLRRLDDLLTRYPNWAFAYSERSAADFTNMQYDQAVADSDAAIHYRPDVPRFYVRRAMAYLIQHKSDKALADLQMASKLDPKDNAPFVHLLAGMALSDLHRYHDALTPLSEAAASMGKDIRPYIQRALCYAHLKNWEKAAADAAHAARISPKDDSVKILQAALLSATGKRDDAAGEFAEVLRRYNDETVIANLTDFGSNVPSVADATDACLRVRKPKLANAVISLVQARRPLDPEEVFVQAKADVALKDYFRAAKLLNECLAIKPGWVDARIELIELYVKDKQLQQARQVQSEGLNLQLSPAERRRLASAIR